MIKVVVVSACPLKEIRFIGKDGTVKFLWWQEETYVGFLWGKQESDIAKQNHIKEQF